MSIYLELSQTWKLHFYICVVTNISSRGKLKKVKINVIPPIPPLFMKNIPPPPPFLFSGSVHVAELMYDIKVFINEAPARYKLYRLHIDKKCWRQLVGPNIPCMYCISLRISRVYENQKYITINDYIKQIILLDQLKRIPSSSIMIE